MMKTERGCRLRQPLRHPANIPRAHAISAVQPHPRNALTRHYRSSTFVLIRVGDPSKLMMPVRSWSAAPRCIGRSNATSGRLFIRSFHFDGNRGSSCNKRATSCNTEDSFDCPAFFWTGESEDARQLHRGFWSLSRFQPLCSGRCEVPRSRRLMPMSLMMTQRVGRLFSVKSALDRLVLWHRLPGCVGLGERRLAFRYNPPDLEGKANGQRDHCCITGFRIVPGPSAKAAEENLRCRKGDVVPGRG